MAHASDRYTDLVESYQAALTPHEDGVSPCSIPRCPVDVPDARHLPAVFAPGTPTWIRATRRLALPVLFPLALVMACVAAVLQSRGGGVGPSVAFFGSGAFAMALPILDMCVVPRYLIGASETTFHLVCHFERALSAARRRNAPPAVVADLQNARDVILDLRAQEAQLSEAASDSHAFDVLHVVADAPQSELESRRLGVEAKVRALVAGSLTYIRVAAELVDAERPGDDAAVTALEARGRGLLAEIDVYESVAAK